MMRRSIGIALIVMIAGATALYSSRSIPYQIVDIYICDSDGAIAPLTAKAAVSRKELYTVSGCKCEGVDRGLRGEVTRTPCEAPRNQVFMCTCVGKAGY